MAMRQDDIIRRSEIYSQGFGVLDEFIRESAVEENFLILIFNPCGKSVFGVQVNAKQTVVLDQDSYLQFLLLDIPLRRLLDTVEYLAFN